MFIHTDLEKFKHGVSHISGELKIYQIDCISIVTEDTFLKANTMFIIGFGKTTNIGIEIY